MVNKIIDGISIKLNQVFGDGYEIYSEDVKQGLKEPCFYISLLNSSQAKRLGSRYFKEHAFDVHYFPNQSGNENEEINEVAEKLFDELEYINVAEDLVCGTKMNTETVDGVLHFFVNYNLHVHKLGEAIDDMQSLEIANGLKG